MNKDNNLFPNLNKRILEHIENVNDIDIDNSNKHIEDNNITSLDDDDKKIMDNKLVEHINDMNDIMMNKNIENRNKDNEIKVKGCGCRFRTYPNTNYINNRLVEYEHLCDSHNKKFILDLFNNEVKKWISKDYIEL